MCTVCRLFFFILDSVSHVDAVRQSLPQRMRALPKSQLLQQDMPLPRKHRREISYPTPEKTMQPHLCTAADAGWTRLRARCWTSQSDQIAIRERVLLSPKFHSVTARRYFSAFIVRKASPLTPSSTTNISVNGLPLTRSWAFTFHECIDGIR